MRVLVVHAHPVETSYNRSLFNAVCETLAAKGDEVDALNLYDEGFERRDEPRGAARLSRRAGQPHAAELKPYVDRLRACDKIVFVHPVWNYGYPAILKGFFDRIFLPGVSASCSRAATGRTRASSCPAMKNITKVAYITTYGGDRFRTWLMGDPPRRLAMRWAWVTFGTRMPPKYLALYDMNNQTEAGLKRFIGRVRREMERF